MRKITDDLIDRFLKGLCTEEEAAAVSDYFESHPEDLRLMDEFLATPAEGGLPMGYSEDMLGFIRGAMDGEDGKVVEAAEVPAVIELFPERRVSAMRRWFGAAAAVMVLGVCGVYLMRSGGHRAVGDGKAGELAIVEWVDAVNQGKKDLHVTLPDGSTVKMMPGARVRYRKDFLGWGKREVMMSGVARFDVVKNDQKPFVVGSGGLNTNVLGTNFEVTAMPGGDRIKVRLYGGKVMVSLDTLAAGNERKDYFLLPGQEFVFEKSSRNVAISAFGKKREQGDDLVTTTGHTARPDSVANWYMFNNQTLGDVFEQLSVIYNVQIQYSKRDISNLYFIGKLEKKDSLHKIIQDIALLNHLTVRTDNGNYIITKKKP